MFVFQSKSSQSKIICLAIIVQEESARQTRSLVKLRLQFRRKRIRIFFLDCRVPGLRNPAVKKNS